MSKYLLLMSEYSKDSDIPDYEHKEDFDIEKEAFKRMMQMYSDAAVNGDPEKIEHSDYGKHWATINFTNGSKTTWEILTSV